MNRQGSMVSDPTHHALIQGSTFDDAQAIIDDFMRMFRDVSATTPVKAADGVYVASIRYSTEKRSDSND